MNQDMNIDQYCVFAANMQIRELKRGSADYWILYVSEGEVEFLAGANMCRAVSGQTVVITLTNLDVQIKPSQDFACCMLRVCDPASAELVRRYLPLMHTYSETMNVITAGKQQKHIAAVFQNMQNTGAGDENGQRALLEELMIRLYRASPKALAGVYTNRTEIVHNIRNQLAQEYSKNFSLTAIAAEYGMSVSYLAHLFKDITGVSIMRYLLNCRVFAAKEYLAQTIIPVNKVAEMCGFHDASNFGRTFRKETGCTPRQYRQQHSDKTKNAGD